MNIKRIFIFSVIIFGLTGILVFIIPELHKNDIEYVLSHPIKMTFDDNIITLKSAQLDNTGCQIVLEGKGNGLKKEDIFIIDGKGNRNNFQSQLFSISGTDWDNTLQLSKKYMNSSSKITLEFGNENNKLELDFKNQ